MRSVLWFSAACAVLVPCLCSKSTQSSCSSDDGGDDQCEFIQKIVSVVSDLGGKPEQKAKGSPASFTEGAGLPDILKDVTKILSGSTDLEADAEAFQKEVQAFATVVHQQAKDLLKSVAPSMKLEQVIEKVDNAGHAIWVALKKVLDALTKVGATFDDGVGKAIPSNSFKSYLDAAIKKITEQGDLLEKHIDMKLKSVDISAVCAEAKKKLDAFKEEADKLSKQIIGITTDGMKKEVADLYKVLPESAQKEINKFIEKANAAGAEFMATATSAEQEIYDAIGLALKGQCPNFATFQRSAAQSKVGMITAIAVSLFAVFV